MGNRLKPKTLSNPADAGQMGHVARLNTKHQGAGKQGTLNRPILCDCVIICNTDPESTWRKVPAGLYLSLIIKLIITSARYGGTSGFGSDLGPFSLKNTL